MTTPDLGDEYIDDLVSQIKDHQLTHGFLLKLVRLENTTTVPSRNIGSSVLPTPFPSRLFSQALDLQTLYNNLYIRASADQAWLRSVLSPFLEHDDFALALWGIHERAQHQRPPGVSRTICGIFRSDYMLHSPTHATWTLKQVEMNTFSVAGVCHAERAAGLHAHLQRIRDLEAIRQGAAPDAESKKIAPGRLPVNSNILTLTKNLKQAHQLYSPSSRSPACVLMIVQPDNINVADERPIEYGLWGEGIACYRCEWQDVLSSTSLTDDHVLTYNRHGVKVEVGVVYYRAGYEPDEYDDSGIEMRLRLEVSRAVKCPDILTHLTTFKAVQQALTRPGAVERFLPADEAARLRETFMYMQTLDSSSEGMEARRLASNVRTARDFVLKPNLEGGGHNIYRRDICDFLATLPSEKEANYVLMRLIEPPAQDGILMLSDDLYTGPIVSELGVLGTCIWTVRKSMDGKSDIEVHHNETAGWTFKTKPARIDEMSVVKGYGCFDCPKLEGNEDD